MVLLDTNLLIERCKLNSEETIYFCDMSIFEMLKNKNAQERFKQFVNLDLFVKKSKSILLTSSNLLNVFDNRNINIRYNEALLICDLCAFAISKSFLDICGMLLQLSLLNKRMNYSKEIDNYSFEKALDAINVVIHDISKNMRNELAYLVFNNKSKDVEEKLYKSLINIFIDKINKSIGSDYLNLNHIISFTTNGIAVVNKVKFKKELIDKYIDDVVSLRSNDIITKEIYKIYLNELLLVSGTIRFNDMVDINIFFSAYSHNLKIETKDKKINKLKESEYFINK